MNSRIRYQVRSAAVRRPGQRGGRRHVVVRPSGGRKGNRRENILHRYRRRGIYRRYRSKGV